MAKRVGYKTQSGISNIENRFSGTGGHKIASIAEALNVSTDWLLNGPDTDNVPFLPPKIAIQPSATIATQAEEANPAWQYIQDKAATPITGAYWPFNSSVERFRRLITDANLEILNGTIETMLRQRETEVEQPQQQTAR